MKKIIATLFFLAMATTANAHVVVKPDSVKIGSFERFTVGVPVERDIATNEIRLIIPEGLEHVLPQVKPGWKIDVVTEEVGEEKMVKEIIWSQGVIPKGFRDEFVFSAKVGDNTEPISWKAYQRYADGQIVSWDKGPNDEQPKKEDGSPDFSTSGPFSSTKIVDDLSQNNTNIWENPMYAFAIALLSLILSLISFTRRRA